MILLAMPDVDELFPVELKVEAALELWLNSESSDSRVLNEFLDFVIGISLWGSIESILALSHVFFMKP